MTLTKEEVGLLKQLKGAGERGRTIRAFDTRIRLDRLVRAGYVTDQPTGFDLAHYRITKRGEDALDTNLQPERTWRLWLKAQIVSIVETCC